MKTIATKFLVPVAVVAGLVTAVDVYVDYSSSRDETLRLQGVQAAMAMAFDLAIREYVAEEIRPAMEERTAPGEFMPETMCTSFVARSIFEKVRQNFPDHLIKFSSDDPRNPANQAGPDELQMIQYFNDHPETNKWSGEIELNGRPYLAHFSARRMKESCLRCHGRPEDAPASLVERYGPTAGFHRPVGKVVALDTVAIPSDKTQAAVMAGILHHVISMVVGIILLVLLIALTFRFVVARRLVTMRTHFEQIAQQPETAPITPVEVAGRDEISSLARSFNALADKVRAAHASLEQRVAERTKDLATTNEELRREIVERKRAEERLRESEERHRAITETAQDAVITADAEGNIRFWNPAAEKVFGFSAAEAIGRNMMEFIVPPQYHEAKRKGLAEFGRTGHGAVMGKTLELTALRKDGSEFPIEISVSGYRDRNAFVGLALVRDITKRKRWERELRTAHAETRQLLESIPSLMIGLDANDKVTAWNTTAERVLGIEARDAVGQSLDDLDIQWDHAAIVRSIAECRAKNRPTRLNEVRFKRADGTEGFLGITLNPVNGGADRSAGLLLFAVDITEQKILQCQLAQAQKLESIGQLAAGIAHEINTPTQFVGDNTRFLQDAFADLQGLLAKYARLAEAGRTGAVTPEILADVEAATKEADLDYLEDEIPRAIAQALEGVERVSRIVRAMKDFSHPGREGMEAVDLNRAIESTVTVARNEWKYVAEMVTDFDPALPLVPCFLGDFNQVILNIVINGAHAIAKVVGDGATGQGTITVSTRHDGDWAEIRIRDTGTGIPPEHRSKVFDHFFTTKEVGKGTGQGLAIAYSVVAEKHGGTITFETEMGRGTTFIIRLPLEHEPATAKETPHHEEAHSLR